MKSFRLPVPLVTVGVLAVTTSVIAQDSAPLRHADRPPISNSVNEADSQITLDAPTKSFFCKLNDGVTVMAHVVMGQKNFPLSPLAISSPTIVQDDGTQQPLFNAVGHVNATELSRDNAVIYMEITEVLKSLELSEAFFKVMAEKPELIGKPWGQPRIKPQINVALKWLDPNNQNEPRTLAHCSFQQMDGKVVHKLRFRIDNDEDLAALRSASRDELFIDTTFDAYCRLKTEMLVAEGASISSAAVELATELQSHAGDETMLFMATGGKLKSKDAIRTLCKRHIDATIATRDGYSPPPEVVNVVTDLLLNGLSREVNLQQENQTRMLGVVVGNRLLVTAPIGQIGGAIDNARKMVESQSMDQLMAASKNSSGGGFSFFGIGANASSMNESQKMEMKQRMLRELDEASKQFQGGLPTVTAMDVSNLQKLGSTDSATIDFALAKFAVRWQPMNIATSLEVTSDVSKRLVEFKAKQAALRTEVEQLTINIEGNAKAARDLVTAAKSVSTEVVANANSMSLQLEPRSFLFLRFRGSIANNKSDEQLLNTCFEGVKGVEEKIVKLPLAAIETTINTIDIGDQSLLSLLKVKLKELETVNGQIETLVRLGAR